MLVKKRKKMKKRKKKEKEEKKKKQLIHFLALSQCVSLWSVSQWCVQLIFNGTDYISKE